MFRYSNSEHEAASCQIADISLEFLILDIICFHIAVHEEVLKVSESRSPDEPFRHIGDQVEQTVLANTEDAFGVGRVLGAIAVEECHSHVHNVEVVAVAVCIEELRDLLRDEVDLLHFFTLCDQLVYGEIRPETVVSL